MKLKVYCIYDAKVEAYMTPFFVQAKGEAVRGFIELANGKESNVGKYPQDFTLFELGDYESDTAKFVLHSTPTSIGCAIEFVNAVDKAS